MFSKIAHRSLLMVFVVALIVSPGVAQAGAFDPLSGRTLPSLGRFQEQVQSWAELLWGSISGVWEKEGVSIDPNGAPKPGDSGTGGTSTGGTTSGEGGGSIDPNGKP
ncbi:MAG TPA: hypothetical protein VEL74_05655 [Thermoanaerobaculia bacterium]|nr:hypothetical protein [Thermoanaerobaculia bacterium]